MYISPISPTPNWAGILSYTAFWRLCHFQFLSSDANSRKNTCQIHGLPPPARHGCSSFPQGPGSQGRGWCCLGLLPESDLYLCWQCTHLRGSPVIVSWYKDRDYTAKCGQQVKRRKACVANIAGKRWGLAWGTFCGRPQSRKTHCEIWLLRDPYWAFG